MKDVGEMQGLLTIVTNTARSGLQAIYLSFRLYGSNEKSRDKAISP